MSHNRLTTEKSPYLKQHASNPVWWYPWGDEAFAAAKAQQKPIFLSIGYATCYWCHVMEKDSFEQVEVAAVLNELFIPIKVDREERPDVDRIYMDTVVALTGHGGWPLSAALTPDLKPYWAGTFFYKEKFIQVLRALSRAWNEDKEKVLDSANEITKEIFKIDIKSQTLEITRQPIELALTNLSKGFDSDSGGFGQAPKFPPPFQLGLILRSVVEGSVKPVYANTSDLENDQIYRRRIITTTLDKMISAGIHDQIGGGFHRYATDANWLTPHFEKMLYDNAQLIHVLAESYQLTANPTYLETAKSSADYLLRDLTSPEGAFYAAEDAGEVGKEGEFYVFQYSELKTMLSSSDFALFMQIFDFSENGNFENGNNIIVRRSGVTLAQWNEASELRQKILDLRSKRTRPLCDTKILTSWNALTIKSLVKLYEVSLEQRYLLAAEKAAHFILDTLWHEDKLLRRYADGEAGITACLEDYACSVEAMLDLFCISGKDFWFESALKIHESQDRILWDFEREIYNDSSATELISKKVELSDGATPAGNSVAAKNLVIFSRLTAEDHFEQKARQILSKFSGTFEDYPHAACRALQALDLLTSPDSQLILCKGEDAEARKIEELLARTFSPNRIQVRSGSDTPKHKMLQALMAAKGKREESLVYVCRGTICSRPMSAKEFIEVT